MDEETPTFLLRPLNRETECKYSLVGSQTTAVWGRVCAWRQITVYLKDMCFEDVMAQLNSLLPVQLVLLPREPKRQQRVAAPAGRRNTSE